MKKLIYSALSFALIATTLFVGCKKDDGTDPVDPVEKGPNISFQTNAGSGSGVFTFADGKVITGEQIKMGIRITSDVNLKSSKMTVNFNNVGEVVLHDTTYTSNTKTSNRDVSYIFPTVKGPYVFTIYAEDKDGNKKSAKITIVAAGPLLDRDDGQFWSLKATGATKFSAFNLFDGEAITASASATNKANRDIVDASTGATLSKTWNSDPANGTEFIISGSDNKLNGKVYSQFNSEQDVLDAWNALSSTKSTSISNVDIGKLIIAKSKRGTDFFYYLIAITNVNDDAGSEDDYYEFQYKQ
ncbi:MAG: hypothetical protein Q8K70_11885 [Bacteroidota bacterium]|nr:hypothetical protein [Bacteroidota bacterium]